MQFEPQVNASEVRRLPEPVEHFQCEPLQVHYAHWLVRDAAIVVEPVHIDGAVCVVDRVRQRQHCECVVGVDIVTAHVSVHFFDSEDQIVVHWHLV